VLNYDACPILILIGYPRDRRVRPQLVLGDRRVKAIGSPLPTIPPVVVNPASASSLPGVILGDGLAVSLIQGLLGKGFVYYTTLHNTTSFSLASFCAFP
jgi:hypothetical protein